MVEEREPVVTTGVDLAHIAWENVCYERCHVVSKWIQEQDFPRSSLISLPQYLSRNWYKDHLNTTFWWQLIVHQFAAV